MKVIIAGTRTCVDPLPMVQAIVASGFDIEEAVSGGAQGVDDMGEKWALFFKVPLKKFPADWSQYGKSAGYKRNKQMAEYADALIAIWDGVSKGTKHMIDLAINNSLTVYIKRLDDDKKSGFVK